MKTLHPSPGRRDCLALLAAAALPALLGGCAATAGGPKPQDYAAAMRRALQSVAGELPGYSFRASPVGNFGVGSIYVDEMLDGDPRQAEAGWFLGGPDAWLAGGLPAAERQRWMGRLVAEGTMGAFDLDAAGSQELQLQAGAALVSALVGSASFSASSRVESRFTASEVRQRRLNWAEFNAALRAGRIAPEVAETVRGRRFVLAAADVVLTGYRAQISIDESRSPEIAAGLRAKSLGLVRTPAGAGLRVVEESRGRFAVSAAQPVVAAVLFKRPPPASKGPEAARDWERLDAWPGAAVDAKLLERVEAQGRKDGGPRP